MSTELRRSLFEGRWLYASSFFAIVVVGFIFYFVASFIDPGYLEVKNQNSILVSYEVSHCKFNRYEISDCLWQVSLSRKLYKIRFISIHYVQVKISYWNLSFKRFQRIRKFCLKKSEYHKLFKMCKFSANCCVRINYWRTHYFSFIVSHSKATFAQLKQSHLLLFLGNPKCF